MTLLAMAAALVVPRLADFLRGRALDAESLRLLAATHAAAGRAVSEGLPVLLWIDASAQTYGLESEPAANGRDGRAQAFAVDARVRLAVEQPAAVTVLLRGMPAIRFLPDGGVDEGCPRALRLSDATGATWWLVRAKGRIDYERRRTTE